jgi:glycerate kinase
MTVALCCPDKFRGSLTAAQAAAAMADGLRATGAEAIELPLADGGEGTLDVLLSAREGRRLRTRVTGPLDAPVDAEWGLLADGTAVIEMARASGLHLTNGRNHPLKAHTRGTGELLREAARHGARRALVTVGGSASTDGGLGAAEALGWSLHGLEVTVACDVTTRFTAAAEIFGPQKGAGPGEIATLTHRLTEYARRHSVPDIPGAGAAGGLAGGLAALGAKLRSGFEAIAEAVGLDAALERADLVVTGEGALDRTSLDGKVVGGVLARTAKPRAVIAGYVEPGLPVDPEVTVRSLIALAGTADRAIAEAGRFVREAAATLAVAEAAA